jgi:DNA-binding transcriptional MerR regulator
MMSVREYADKVGVHPGTVHRWFKKGLVAGTRFRPGSGYRVLIDESALYADVAKVHIEIKKARQKA